MKTSFYKNSTSGFCRKIIGIDLGTTNSVMAVMQGGSATVIPNAEGGRTTPSVVAYTTTKEALVGELAQRQSQMNVQNTFYSSKRFIGQLEDDAIVASPVLYDVVINDEDKRYSFFSPNLGRNVAPEEVSAEILKKLARDASAYLGEKVETAIITVPAYFNEAQRQATKDAGIIAGLKVERVINEPTAAAMAWGLTDTKKCQEGYMLIFDLGGGTFDVSVMDYNDDVFEVLGTSGDAALGGDDFDQVISDWIGEILSRDYQISEAASLTRPSRKALEGEKSKTDEEYCLEMERSHSMQRIATAATKLKVDLSTLEEVTLTEPYIVPSLSLFTATFSRSEFESRCNFLFEKIRLPIASVFEDINTTTTFGATGSISPDEIANTLLVGGSTRIPAVRRLAQELMGKAPHEPENPDELVALGAALQGAICTGELKDVLLVDVTPLTLGIDTFGNIMQPIISRQSTVPRTETETFSTAADNQSGVTIVVCQGERPTTNENKVLGTFELTGIKPARRGVPRIQVTFDLDVNGILKVTAVDKETNRRQKIDITGSSNLSKDEIDKIVEEAERYKDDDNTLVSALRAAHRAQVTIDIAKKVVASKDNPLDSEKTATAQRSIEVLDQALEKVFSECDKSGPSILRPNDFAASLKIIEHEDASLTAILSSIPAERMEAFTDTPDNDGNL